MNIPLSQISKHHGLQAGAEVRQICEPLFKLGFTYFHYFKVIDKSRFISLCTHPHLVEFRYSRYPQGILTVDNDLNDERIIWGLPPYDKTALVSLLKETFDIAYGITLRKKLDKGEAFYHFASSRCNASVIDIYVNHSYLLERFIAYFLYRANRLINKCETSSVIYKNPQSIYIADRISCSQKDNMHRFIKQTESKNSYLGNRTVSKKEWLCLQQVAQGKTASEIADKLFISKRTVETHLSNLKIKFDCQKLTSLVYLASKSGFLDMSEK